MTVVHLDSENTNLQFACKRHAAISENQNISLIKRLLISKTHTHTINTNKLYKYDLGMLSYKNNNVLIILTIGYLYRKKFGAIPCAN